MLFSIQGLYSQTLNRKINGLLINQLPYKYAYLVDLNRKDIIMSPILNKKFHFDVKQDDDFELRKLFLSGDSTENFDTYLQKSRERTLDERLLAIDSNAEIFIRMDVNGATVKGGKYNSDIEDMNATIQNKEYLTFFTNHPDSPISLMFINVLLSINSSFSLLKKTDFEQFFSKLSVKLRNTEKGKEVSKKIEAI